MSFLSCCICGKVKENESLKIKNTSDLYVKKPVVSAKNERQVLEKKATELGQKGVAFARQESSRRLKILVVESRPPNQGIDRKRLLITDPYNDIFFSGNVDESLCLASRIKYDLIISEGGIPLMDRIKMIKSLRAPNQQNSHTVIIGQIPGECQEAITKMKEAGITGFVSKKTSKLLAKQEIDDLAKQYSQQI